jgi:hypothetical protein
MKNDIDSDFDLVKNFDPRLYLHRAGAPTDEKIWLNETVEITENDFRQLELRLNSNC